MQYKKLDETNTCYIISAVRVKDADVPRIEAFKHVNKKWKIKYQYSNRIIKFKRTFTLLRKVNFMLLSNKIKSSW